MPMRRVLVRHGQSEANVVQKELLTDIDPEVVAEIYSRPDWMQRLSPLGVEQARQAGDWIRREIGSLASFDVVYASPFLRTFETACYAAGEEGIDLTPEDRIIERDWGLYGKLSKVDQERIYPDTYRNKNIDPLHARLNGGESIMDVFLRWRDMAGTLHREYPNGNVLMFTHGDYQMTDIYASERRLPEEFVELMRDSNLDMMNCSVIDRTRRNPFDPEDIREKPSWVRIVHTIAPELSPNGGEWVELKSRRTYTVAEGLARVAQTPTILPQDVLAQLRKNEQARLKKKAEKMGISLREGV
ncbi:MAG: histidine phosphatase family protein [Acidobacteriota bacterium]